EWVRHRRHHAQGRIYARHAAPGVSGEELVQRVEVSGVDPDLSHPPVAEVENQWAIVREGLPIPVSPRDAQGHSVLVIGKGVVELRAEGSAADLEDLREETEHL